MTTYAIYLTVDLPQEELLQEIRESFDPLAGMVPPHITVVFPFESDIAREELVELIDTTVEELDCFYVEISLEAAVFVEGFCFFPIREGRDIITDLHDQLYAGSLESFLNQDYEYTPHITVGRVREEGDREEIRERTDEVNLFQTGSVRSIILERLEAEFESTTEYERSLRPTGEDAE